MPSILRHSPFLGREPRSAPQNHGRLPSRIRACREPTRCRDGLPRPAGSSLLPARRRRGGTHLVAPSGANEICQAVKLPEISGLTARPPAPSSVRLGTLPDCLPNGPAFQSVEIGPKDPFWMDFTCARPPR